MNISEKEQLKILIDMKINKSLTEERTKELAYLIIKINSKKFYRIEKIFVVSFICLLIALCTSVDFITVIEFLKNKLWIPLLLSVFTCHFTFFIFLKCHIYSLFKINIPFYEIEPIYHHLRKFFLNGNSKNC